MSEILNKNIFFRTDASLEIGNGHVMRCLTLADKLRDQGYECQFICRDHEGHLNEIIKNKGFKAHLLMRTERIDFSSSLQGGYEKWLGASWNEDALQTIDIIKEYSASWLVVDHYGIDYRWEYLVAKSVENILVIDDLANRPHQCDILLDQTFSRNAASYKALVSGDCKLLCGSNYALLRPEFGTLRAESLYNRKDNKLKKILISMGGVDINNVTGKILKSLHDCKLPKDIKIIVVLGSTAPWLEDVNQQVKKLPWDAELRVAVDNMAELMAESCLAIGASGATSWERCALGLPTILLVLADNQIMIADELSNAGAVVKVDDYDEIPVQVNRLIDNSYLMQTMSRRSASIVDGRGTERVQNEMEL